MKNRLAVGGAVTVVLFLGAAALATGAQRHQSPPRVSHRGPGLAARPTPPPSASPTAAPVASDQASRLQQTTAVSVDAPAAWISVPAIHLTSIPIFDRGLNARRQMLIAGGFSVTHYVYSGALGGPSNAVLYGHDDIEGGVFGHLMQLHPGDQVSLRLLSGQTLTYRVQAPPRLVSPSDLSILGPGSRAELTLFSCWPLWIDTQRSVVVATQI